MPAVGQSKEGELSLEDGQRLCGEGRESRQRPKVALIRARDGTFVPFEKGTQGSAKERSAGQSTRIWGIGQATSPRLGIGIIQAGVGGDSNFFTVSKIDTHTHTIAFSSPKSLLNHVQHYHLGLFQKAQVRFQEKTLLRDRLNRVVAHPRWRMAGKGLGRVLQASHRARPRRAPPAGLLTKALSSREQLANLNLESLRELARNKHYRYAQSPM